MAQPCVEPRRPHLARTPGLSAHHSTLLDQNTLMRLPGFLRGETTAPAGPPAAQNSERDAYGELAGRRPKKARSHVRGWREPVVAAPGPGAATSAGPLPGGRRTPSGPGPTATSLCKQGSRPGLTSALSAPALRRLDRPAAQGQAASWHRWRQLPIGPAAAAAGKSWPSRLTRGFSKATRLKHYSLPTASRRFAE